MHKLYFSFLATFFFVNPTSVLANSDVPCNVVWEFIADGAINSPLSLATIESDPKIWRERSVKCSASADAKYNWDLAISQNWVESRLESMPKILEDLKAKQETKFKDEELTFNSILQKVNNMSEGYDVKYYIDDLRNMQIDSDSDALHPDVKSKMEGLIERRDALLDKLVAIQNKDKVITENEGSNHLLLASDNKQNEFNIDEIINDADKSIIKNSVMPFDFDKIQSFLKKVEENSSEIQSSLTLAEVQQIQTDPEKQKLMLTNIYVVPLDSMGYSLNDTLKAGAIKFLKDDFTMDDKGTLFVALLAMFVPAANQLHEFGLIDEQARTLLKLADEKK